MSHLHNYNKLSKITHNNNKGGQFLLYDNNTSGYTNKYHQYKFLFIDYNMSPYVVEDVNQHINVDTTDGDVILLLPEPGSLYGGGSIVVTKVSNDINSTYIRPVNTAYTYLDGTIEQEIFKQYSCIHIALGYTEYSFVSDSRTLKTTIEVASDEISIADFTDIKSAIDYANILNFNTTIKINAGEHYIADTVTINNIYSATTTFIGSGVNATFIYAYTGLTNKPMFNIITSADFYHFTIDGSNLLNYGNLSTENCMDAEYDGTFMQYEDIIFNGGFYNTLNLSGHSEVWLFDSDIVNSTNCGILVSGSSLSISETTLSNNKIGINLAYADNDYFTVQNTFIENNSTGITYVGDKFIYDNIFINSNSFRNNQLNLTGFNFSIQRDYNIEIVNNAGISDYTPRGFITMNSNNTQYTMATQTRWYKISGVTTSNLLIKFSSGDTYNRLQYVAPTKEDLSVIVTGDIECDTNTVTPWVGLMKNGQTGQTQAIVKCEIRLPTANQASPFSLHYIISQDEYNINDYWELMTFRNVGTSNTSLYRVNNLQYSIRKI